jgi:DNA gyrase subunit B
MLEQLGKRYSLLEVLKHLIENSDLVNLDFAISLYENVKEFLKLKVITFYQKLVLDE